MILIAAYVSLSHSQQQDYTMSEASASNNCYDKLNIGARDYDETENYTHIIIQHDKHEQGNEHRSKIQDDDNYLIVENSTTFPDAPATAIATTNATQQELNQSQKHNDQLDYVYEQMDDDTPPLPLPRITSVATDKRLRSDCCQRSEQKTTVSCFASMVRKI